MSHEFFTAPEMYLKTIFNLEVKNGAARTGDIAKILGITPGSVTNTLEVLEGKGLVVREPYKGVNLTDQGRKLALSVFRRHRLAERLLVDMLQVDWIQCHEEACRLEHSISDEVANLIQKKLDDPKTCPHGNPIPDENGYIAPSKNDSLSNLGNGEHGVVAMVPDESTEVLRYLSTLGMVPGAKIIVEEKAPFKGPMLVKVGESSYPISLDVASAIFVSREK